MDFDWDDAKSDRCFHERGFDFETIIPAFADPGRVVEDALRYEYGEPRFRLYGRVEGRLFVVVFTLREGVHRITSAGKANRKEVTRYGKGKAEN